ncbi:hypothetical protein SEA_ESTES_54 [Mycobacterium phage Estes]|uniref:Uncharacterized protein n=1 Tax=Mycobacterium phage Estes TaxID=2759459 RepID=A0A7G9A2C4_9CAUD|nr:hypothetical protein J4U03_gp054 [Mycobacterium phage Estes]QNL30763.1 hypothetical protein SEA_ESTES_54 [Mycobacterium phage Estes]
MSLETFVHNPTEVRAIQVARPFKRVADAVPYARSVQHPYTRKFLYIAISKPGVMDDLKAYENDWIIIQPGGWVMVMSAEVFSTHYSQLIKEDDADSDTA